MNFGEIMKETELKQIKSLIRDFHSNQSQFKKNFWKELQLQCSPTAYEKLKQLHLSHSAIQVLSYVSQGNNGTLAYQKLLQQVDFSQGMLSRHVKKLTDNELLKKSYHSNNHKEVFLKVSNLGRVVARVHDSVHKTETISEMKRLTDFTNQDLKITRKVLTALKKAN